MLTSGTVKKLHLTNNNKNWNFFLLLDFDPGQLASFMFVLSYEAGFLISQLSSKSTLPLAGLQHMQRCQLGWNNQLSLFDPRF
jgi:hypothetical protein